MTHPYDPPRYARLDAALNYTATALSLAVLAYVGTTTALWARVARRSPEIQVRDPKLTMVNTAIAAVMAGISAFDGLHPVLHRTLLGGYLLNFLICLYLVGLMFRTMRLLRLYNLNKSRLSSAYTQAVLQGGFDNEQFEQFEQSEQQPAAVATDHYIKLCCEADGGKLSNDGNLLKAKELKSQQNSLLLPPPLQGTTASSSSSRTICTLLQPHVCVAAPSPARPLRMPLHSVVMHEMPMLPLMGGMGRSVDGSPHSRPRTPTTESLIAPWTPPATPPPAIASFSQQQSQSSLSYDNTKAKECTAPGQNHHTQFGNNHSSDMNNTQQKSRVLPRWEAWKRRLRSDIFENVSITKFTLQRRYLWAAYAFVTIINIIQCAGTITRYEWYGTRIEACMVVYCSGAVFTLIFVPLVAIQLVRLRDVKDLYHVRSDCLFLCSFLVVTFLISFGLAIGLPYEWRYNQHIFFIMGTNAFVAHHLGVALPMLRSRQRLHERKIADTAFALSRRPDRTRSRTDKGDGQQLELGYSMKHLERCLENPRYLFQLKMRAAKSLCIENILFVEDCAKLWRPTAAAAANNTEMPLTESLAETASVRTSSDNSRSDATITNHHHNNKPQKVMDLSTGVSHYNTHTLGRTTVQSLASMTTTSAECKVSSSTTRTTSTVVPDGHRAAYLQLYRDYLTSASELELNVPSEYRKEVEAALCSGGEIHCNIFDRVRSQCLENIFSGLYMDFIKSQTR